jgi:hypothetical protein
MSRSLICRRRLPEATTEDAIDKATHDPKNPCTCARLALKDSQDNECLREKAAPVQTLRCEHCTLCVKCKNVFGSSEQRGIWLTPDLHVCWIHGGCAAAWDEKRYINGVYPGERGGYERRQYHSWTS